MMDKNKESGIKVFVDYTKVDIGPQRATPSSPTKIQAQTKQVLKQLELFDKHDEDTKT